MGCVTYLDTGSARIFYTDSEPDSTNVPLVFVHGWTCDSNDWIWQLPEISKRFRAVALDLRGHGRSSTPAAGYRLSDYAADVVALVQGLHVRQVVLIGHSMGALICSLISDQQPDLVAALVVIDAPYAITAAGISEAAQFAQRVAYGNGVAVVTQWLSQADLETTPSYLVEWHRRRIAAMPQHVLAETVADVHDNAVSIANTPFSQQLWSRRAMPTLVVAANREAADREVPFFQSERSLAVTIEAVGHWPHQERPDDFNDILSNWLDTQATVATPL